VYDWVQDLIPLREVEPLSVDPSYYGKADPGRRQPKSCLRIFELGLCQILELLRDMADFA